MVCFLRVALLLGALGTAVRASHLGRQHKFNFRPFPTKHPFGTPSCEMQTAGVVVNFEFLFYYSGRVLGRREFVICSAPNIVQSSPHQFGCGGREVIVF